MDLLGNVVDREGEIVGAGLHVYEENTAVAKEGHGDFLASGIV